MRSQSPLQADAKEAAFRKYRVLFRYVPQHDDELSICEGDIISVLHEVEEGWWKGVLNGQVGMFPSNFVEEIVETKTTGIKTNELNGNTVNAGVKDQARSSSNSPDGNFPPKIVGSLNSAFHPIHTKREDREAKKESHPDINASNKSDKNQLPKVSKTDSIEKDRQSYEKDKITISIGEDVNRRDKEALMKAPSSALDSAPPQLPPKPVRELARVVFPYSADHDDELELSEGDVITVLCKELEDKGWWKGELNGNVGVFPDNFVELMTVDDAVKPPRPEKRPTALPKPKHNPESTPTASKKDAAPKPLPQPSKKTNAIVQTKKSDSRDGPTDGELCTDSIDGNDSLSLDREIHLVHRTQLRPKGPSNRRPPSQTFLDEKKTSLSDDDEIKAPIEDLKPMRQTSLNSTPAEVPWMRELKANQIKKRLKGGPAVDSPQSSSGDDTFSLPANSHRRSDVTPPTKTRTSASSAKVGSSPANVNTSAASTNGYKEDSFLGHIEYDAIVHKIRAEFSPQIKKLEERLSEQQQRHSRQLLMLMDELGEERQKIACLQIDVDRLTKLASSDANV